jgi:serine phosphatase RsbU (regulator of sigma subunit)
MIKLRVTMLGSAPVERQFDQDEVIIGRSSRAHLLLPDRALSREHARLTQRDGVWYVEDLGSRNGTTWNGQRIAQARRLAEGDHLGLGGSTLTVLEIGRQGAALLPEEGEVGQHTIFLSASKILRDAELGEVGKGEDDASTLRRHVERLNLLNEVQRALSRSISREELLELILDRAFSHLKPEQGAIFLKVGAGGEFRRAASRVANPAVPELQVSRSLVREVADRGLAALVLDARTDARFSEAASLMNVGLRSILAAPLMDPEGAVGMIVLGTRVALRQYSEDDAQLLVTLGSVAAMRLRNIALAEEAAERRRLESEVALARRIQVALLPETLPTLPGWEVHAGNVPSRVVSGDYYVVVPRLGGNGAVLMIADVSGKGIAAALLTASLEALAAGPIEDGLPPEQVCERVSRRLFQRTPPEKYATAFVASVDGESGSLCYANAGHNPALLVRADGETRWLGSTGVPLGLLPQAAYGSAEVELGAGDLVVLYTDGITEATNAAEDEYGGQRLEAVCRAHRDAPLPALQAAIEGDLDAFTGGVPYADDRTIVMLRRRR